MKAPANVPQQATRFDHRSNGRDHGSAEFANTISHELRTPLNVIIGMCQFLERDQETPLSPVHRDAVDRMDRNARALLQSVNQLLAYLRDNQHDHH